MNRQKTLVFFGAHPDDESFGIGSTLAMYASAGVKTYYVCSTGGELGTVEPGLLNGFETIKQLRSHEMECAARVLGLAGVYYLGYRDSGMRGSADNRHPDSMAMAPVEEVTARIVKIIRDIKPDVVITHDEGGGYGHPDHVATNKAAVKAFYAAGDPGQYPEIGPAFQPHKLYFAIHPRRFMKIMVRLMPLFGQDPHHYGRNKDVDLTRMMGIEYPVHAVIRLSREAVDTRSKAIACHASQSSGQRRPWLFRTFEMLSKLQGPRDCYFRVYPSPDGKRREKDLFQGIT